MELLPHSRSVQPDKRNVVQKNGLERGLRMLPESICWIGTEQLDTYIECFQEDFSLVLDDLACTGKEAVVVEGNQLLPALVAPLLRQTDRAIWAIPAEQFQLEHYSKRTWIQGILQRTEKPEQAFRNWMKRYFGF